MSELALTLVRLTHSEWSDEPGRVPNAAQPIFPQVVATCKFCNSALTLGRGTSCVSPAVEQSADTGRGGKKKGIAWLGLWGEIWLGYSKSALLIAPADLRRDVLMLQISHCPNCSKPLPRCALCLLPFECVPFDPRNVIDEPDMFWSSGLTPRPPL